MRKLAFLIIVVILGMVFPIPYTKAMANDVLIDVTAVGDIMLGTGYPDIGYLPPDDGKGLLDSVKEFLVDADITVGNLEGVLLDTGKTVKRCSDPSLCYAFRMPTRYVSYLKQAGFDVMSIANNHIGDFGDPGRNNTVETLRKNGIYYAGLENCPETRFEINGVRVGFCAFAPNYGTVDLRDIRAAQALVKKLDAVCDIVLVAFHGGAEGASHRHVTRKTETFYNENRGNVYEFSHRVIDAGADAVFGHGPHVTRAVELYKNRFIAYSLGNFCTYGPFNLRGPNGMAPIIKITLNATGEFVEGRIIPIIQEKPGGPKLDPEKKVIREIQSLTRSDFPETKLNIDHNGLIKKSEP